MKDDYQMVKQVYNPKHDMIAADKLISQYLDCEQVSIGQN